MRPITNHVSIEKYQLRFFPSEDFSCLCEVYPIKTKHHILHKYKRFNKHWNMSRSMLSYLVAFLQFNSSTFTFHDSEAVYSALIISFSFLFSIFFSFSFSFYLVLI